LMVIDTRPSELQTIKNVISGNIILVQYKI